MGQAHASYVGVKSKLDFTLSFTTAIKKKFKKIKIKNQVYYMLRLRGLNIYTECNE